MGAEHEAKVGSVEIHGVAGSMNTMSTVLLASAMRCGKLVRAMPPKDTNTPEFLAMNPFRQIPALQDQGVHLAESSAILRYLAEKYAHDLYPAAAPRRAFIDWAMDRFASSVYADATKTIYVALGYRSKPEKPIEVASDCVRNLDEFAAFFLQEKFIGGEKPSIADYRVAPFFFAWAHPVLKEAHHVEVPERILQFNKDFAAACPAAGLLESAGGFSLKEMLDTKRGSVAQMLTTAKPASYHKDDHLKHKHHAGKGKAEIYGFPTSPNAAGPVMFVQHAGLGKVVHCVPGEGTKTKEFLAMNPFHAVPTLKDGDVVLAESNAVLRYLATTHAQEYYPTAKRSFIDWALDRFSTGMYYDVTQTIYPCLGFGEMPKDSHVRKAHGRKACENLQSFADFFLKEKFVGGDHVSIADFKVAPVFFAYGHSMLREKFFMETPARILQFNADFATAVKESVLLTQAAGESFKEVLDKHAVLHRGLKDDPKEEALKVEMSHEAAKIEPLLEEREHRPVCGCW